jgi:membrane-associated phospholipid phosphatase
MRNIATLISIIFEPLAVILVFFVLALRLSTLNNVEQLRLFLIALGSLLGIPLILRVWAIRKGILSDWDIRNRSERPKALLVLFVIEIITILLLKPLMDSFLWHLCVITMIWLIGYMGITLFWKISGHSGVAALGTGLVVAWLGFGFWPVLLIVPLVAWSRVVRKDHTVAQVIAGALYAWLFVFVFL